MDKLLAMNIGCKSVSRQAHNWYSAVKVDAGRLICQGKPTGQSIQPCILNGIKMLHYLLQRWLFCTNYQVGTCWAAWLCIYTHNSYVYIYTIMHTVFCPSCSLEPKISTGVTVCFAGMG